MNTELIEAIATRAGWALLNSLWQGVLLGLAVALLLLVARGSAMRHAIAFFALLGMAALLLANIFHYQPQIVAQPKVDQPEASMEKASTSPVSVGLIEAPTPLSVDHSSTTPVVASPADEPPLVAASGTPDREPLAHRLQPALRWIAGFWLLGVAVLSLRQFGAWICLRRWRRSRLAPTPKKLEALGQQVRARMGVLREIPILVSEKVDAPILLGVLKPVVLLPVAVIYGLKQEELEAILAHEFAHFKRRDSWANIIQIGIETVMFYHPVVWWLGRMARRERENAADDLALESGTCRSTYALALAAVAELQVAPPALAASGGSVVARIRRVLSPAPEQRSAAAIAGFASGLALAAIITTITLFQLSPGIAQEEKAEGPRIEVALGESIQDAIDAAEHGSIIVLGEGTFTERIQIKKPLTLEGAGWEKTLFQPQGAHDPRATLPTIWINGTEGVAIRGIKVSLSAEDQKAVTIGQRGVIFTESIVSIKGSEVSISDAAVVGPSGHGVVIAEASKVKMERTLVAAVWSSGVVVAGAKEAANASQLEMDQCVVRNCHHRGILIGSNCDSTVIKRSLISGSAWHGIRYDHCSPRIERNIIFGSAGSGIYASGKTKATVRHNTFSENGTGMVCQFATKDTIDGNVFTDNRRGAIIVFGDSIPTISTNWFVREVVGISCRKLDDRSDVFGKPVGGGNRFSLTESPFQISREDADPPGENFFIDGNPESPQDYGPANGADRVIPAAEMKHWLIGRHWPEALPEEALIIPQGKTRDAREWNKSGVTREKLAKAPMTKQQRWEKQQEIYQAIKPWIDDAFQLDDTARREAAIEKVRAALNSDDQTEIHKGLVAFTSLGQIRFDKATFHDLFVPQLKAENPTMRILAGRSLITAGVQDGDIDRLVALTEDDDIEVRASAGGILIFALQKDLTGEPGAAILKLLNDPEPEVQAGTIHSLWGAKFSPGIEARVIELSNTEKIESFSVNGIAYDALYYALSPQANKSEVSVKRLIDFLAAHDTTNVAGRAAWGLRQGVAQEQHALVADAALKVVGARAAGGLFSRSMELLDRYATAGQIGGIEALLAKPGVDADFRQGLEETLAKLASE